MERSQNLKPINKKNVLMHAWWWQYDIEQPKCLLGMSFWCVNLYLIRNPYFAFTETILWYEMILLSEGRPNIIQILFVFNCIPNERTYLKHKQIHWRPYKNPHATFWGSIKTWRHTPKFIEMWGTEVRQSHPGVFNIGHLKIFRSIPSYLYQYNNLNYLSRNLYGTYVFC